MSGTCQREAAGSEATEAGSSVVLIEGARSPEIGAAMAQQGLEFELAGSAGELAKRDTAPALVVLWAEDSLARAVTGDLEPLRRQMPAVPVVLVCAGLRPGELRLALAAGASGVVLEGELSSALPACLQAARSGQVCVPKQHSRQVEPAPLSAREKQILGLVVMGYMNSEIASQLFVAESTVKSHLSSVFGKLGVRSRNEAVDLILDSERGLGMGILGLGGEPIETIETKATAR
jgi:DNA-binding NarL/FixJ family response regulator